MKEAIADESVFLRINEFKNGLIQFTDSTNAMRLVKEHGRDIRYNAAWKNGLSGTESIGKWTRAGF